MRSFFVIAILAASAAAARADSTLPSSSENAPWKASCRAAPPERWGGLVARFTFAPLGERLSASGELQFAERTARAKLDGKRNAGGWRLDGEMVEVGGLGTHWKLRIDLRAKATPYHFEATLFEMVPGDPTTMCSFELTSRFPGP